MFQKQVRRIVGRNSESTESGSLMNLADAQALQRTVPQAALGDARNSAYVDQSAHRPHASSHPYFTQSIPGERQEVFMPVAVYSSSQPPPQNSHHPGVARIIPEVNVNGQNRVVFDQYAWPGSTTVPQVPYWQ